MRESERFGVVLIFMMRIGAKTLDGTVARGEVPFLPPHRHPALLRSSVCMVWIYGHGKARARGAASKKKSNANYKPSIDSRKQTSGVET